RCLEYYRGKEIRETRRNFPPKTEHPQLVAWWFLWLVRHFSCWAVYGDRFDVFVHLMKYPQDFSLVNNDDGSNVLHWVGRYGTVRFLEQFGQQTIKKLIDGRDKNNITPLHWAAYLNKHDVIRWLLAKGANPELKDFRGQRPDEQYGCDGVTKEIFRSFRSS
uniref:Uncharacterized protein n=1 Tax=Clytia hemisphaerica TaxID=252671 RepID=A0A7M5XL89_9CNID